MQLMELMLRVLCDVRPGRTADAVFLFGQTEDNQASVFSKACRLLEENAVARVLFIGSGPKSGYPGDAAWKAALGDMGVPVKCMAAVDLKDAVSLNTLIEAQGAIRHAKENGYADLVVTASPFHQLRAYMTAVTVALEVHPQLRIYSCPGDALPWQDAVAHSQGTTSGRRIDLFHGELERIRTYQKKGDLADTVMVLDYLDRRDQVQPHSE